MQFTHQRYEWISQHSLSWKFAHRGCGWAIIENHWHERQIRRDISWVLLKNFIMVILSRRLSPLSLPRSWKRSLMFFAKEMTAILPEKEKALFSNYVLAYNEFSSMGNTDSFISGFRLGAKFTYDMFITKTKGWKLWQISHTDRLTIIWSPTSNSHLRNQTSDLVNGGYFTRTIFSNTRKRYYLLFLRKVNCISIVPMLRNRQTKCTTF